MQDIHPDIITGEELVSEIIMRANQGGQEVPLSGGVGPSRKGSLLPKPMSIEEEEDEGVVEVLKGAFCYPYPAEVVLLDCQNPGDYLECHIRGALNVTFPSIMIRRIAAGKIDIFEKSRELKAKIANAKITFVVYDGGEETSDLVQLISKKLAQNGCRVATLKGGLTSFRDSYPEWVDSSDTNKKSSSTSSSTSSSGVVSSSSLSANTSSSSSSTEGSPDPHNKGRLLLLGGSAAEVPLLGLGSLASLKIHDDPDNCDSCIGLDPDDAFPVEIIPNLYLGNASISSDLGALERHNIKHILNVTPDLPNVFEGAIRYLQIPISDHWTSTLLNHFIPAIQFIDEGRSKDEGVLVHCLAGISRSVTITMAYLMYKMNLSLNEAYDIVRAKKANISPNFHFMGQLLDFERQLTTSQFLSPPVLGSSPDSGIEFDRWQTSNN